MGIDELVAQCVDPDNDLYPPALFCGATQPGTAGEGDREMGGGGRDCGSALMQDIGWGKIWKGEIREEYGGGRCLEGNVNLCSGAP